jgi:hypothetical protein
MRSLAMHSKVCWYEFSQNMKDRYEQKTHPWENVPFGTGQCSLLKRIAYNSIPLSVLKRLRCYNVIY